MCGINSIHIRFKDNFGFWSEIKSFDFELIGSTTFDTVYICEGQFYEFGTQSLTQTGEYTEVFKSKQGCDSTVVLTLTVNPIYNHTDAVSICEGETYEFGTQSLTQTGEYTEVFESINACDSTVVLTLTVESCTVPANEQITSITLNTGTTDCFNATNTINVAGDGTQVIVESDALVDFIAGQNIRFLPGFHAQAGSYTHGYITTTGDYCIEAVPAIVEAKPKIKEAVFTKTEITGLDEREMVVYPNPNNGEFIIEFHNFEGEIMVMLFNSIGQMVYNETTAEREIQFKLPNIESGIYFIKAVNENEQFNRKLIVR